MLSKHFMDVMFDFFGESNRTLFELQSGTRPEILSNIQYNITEYLYFKSGVTLSELSDCMYMSMPNASREVKKLVDKGFVEKVYNQEDKRKHLIVLSDAGKELMGKTFALIVKKGNERYKDLSSQEQKELEDAMALLMKKLFI